MTTLSWPLCLVSRHRLRLTLNFSKVASESCQGCHAGRYVIHADKANLQMGFMVEPVDATVQKMLAQSFALLYR